MLQDQISRVVKHSVAYSFAFSQPFAFYVDAYPLMQNEVLEQSNMLQFGMQHESVRMLQHKLQKLSYYDSSIDGEFGVLTEYALTKFQQEHLLEQNGKANEKTVKAIINEEEEYYENLLQQHELTFSMGDRGEDVKEVQEALFYFGYYRANIDGIYGEKSNEAIEAYKQDTGEEIHHIEAEIHEKTVEAPQVASVEVTEQESNEKSDETNQEEAEANKETPVKKENTSTSKSSVSASQIISSAKEHIGTPYRWGGTSTSGFDCSGYLQYVYNQLDVNLPRTVSEIWNATKHIDQPSVGDLVFFETYKPGPSHAGIYLGDGKFIHAGESNGVEISELNVSYWSERYLGAKRVSLH
ncbi:Cell wall-associated hydrolase, NlpC family [Gracilibacillus orientalis]|uniref:Cell wall-associated hydrolase, NlpC family n=1 Tax=Gracilibacillus orientalis TaxID=334253 RepID=A0A1I4L4Z3_9BACI|nr:NlpC/P60 family protein [Gracilibacillus orientalis]SFL86085.1 Cell wall-associated hydrolase, NlpC family [Gracilibacillus orientalis]